MISTISRYVEGLGGHLELRAIFENVQTVPLALPATDAAACTRTS